MRLGWCTNGAVFLLTGFSRSASPFGSLPFDLTPYGAPGCLVRVSPDAVALLLHSSGTVPYSIAIPAGPAFLGLDLFQQAIVLDASAGNALGAVVSHAGQARVGT